LAATEEVKDMKSNRGAAKRRLLKESSYHLVRALLFFIFLFLFSIPMPGLAQEAKEEGKEPQDKFSYLIDNGSRMIRENEFEKVLNIIGELSSEKKWDFKVKVLENSAYLKGYLVTKKMSMVRSGRFITRPCAILGIRQQRPY
jgi:hypothetical protein